VGKFVGKYIVVKNDGYTEAFIKNALDGMEIVDDAVVIRKQDMFAGPALHGYAASISIAAKLTSDLDEANNLQRTADYFHEQALDADAHVGKIPD
jgi:hypothetical protein